MQIILQPVLIQRGRELISKLEKVLSEEFNSSVSNALPIREIPLNYLIKRETNGNQMKYYNGFWISIDQIKQQQE